MPRPQRLRRICSEPEYVSFQPEKISSDQDIILTMDEYETIRLVDYEKLTHEDCSKQMGISRTTVTEIYESARQKLADCIVNGKRLRIAGGNYQVCNGYEKCFRGSCCKASSYDPANASKIKETDTKNKESKIEGEHYMKVAVTYENGQIFQHFGHTEAFKIYTIADGKILSSQVVSTNGSGHGALAGFLSQNSVDTIICGGIGGGAQTALSQMGIKLYGGVTGNADEAVHSLLAGNLSFNPDVHCEHHDLERSDGEHHCGENGCGNHGCH